MDDRDAGQDDRGDGTQGRAPNPDSVERASLQPVSRESPGRENPGPLRRRDERDGREIFRERSDRTRAELPGDGPGHIDYEYEPGVAPYGNPNPYSPRAHFDHPANYPGEWPRYEPGDMPQRGGYRDDPRNDPRANRDRYWRYGGEYAKPPYAQNSSPRRDNPGHGGESGQRYRYSDNGGRVENHYHHHDPRHGDQYRHDPQYLPRQDDGVPAWLLAALAMWMQQQQQGNPGHGKGQGNPHGKEGKTMEGNEKVSVNLGAGGFGFPGGFGGGHSDGGSNAALLALLAMGQNHRDSCNDGFGGGGIGALLALALLGGGRFGGFGGGHDGVHVDCGRRGGRDGYDGDPFVLSKLGSIEGAIPLAASQIQNGILESTAGITNTINQTGLAQLAATSGVKDAVQNSATAILQNASANTQSVLTAICTLSAKIDQNTILDLQRQLGVAEADACEERNSRRTREVEVNVTQQVNQQQAQAQLQRIEDDRFNRLFSNLSAFIGNQAMYARQGQDVINFGGTMTASGTQAAANTQVR